jgi:hypothetical protein
MQCQTSFEAPHTCLREQVGCERSMIREIWGPGTGPAVILRRALSAKPVARLFGRHARGRVNSRWVIVGVVD